MAWAIEYTDQFEDWWLELTEEQQEALTARIELLEQRGPDLGRPTVDSLDDTRVHNLKELRCEKDGSLRVLFVFDPRRTAILLLGGNKAEGSEWLNWYRDNIPAAEALYDEYLDELRGEGEL